VDAARSTTTPFRRKFFIEPEATMLQPALPAHAHDAVVTVRSNTCWIARTQVPCFSCLQLSNVLGLFFAADSAIDRHERGSPRRASGSDEIEYFQLIYVRRISAPTLEDTEHFYEDYDMRVDCRYVMNHCDGCRSRFSDSKLFESADVLFNSPHPARRSRIALRRGLGPVLATGCMTPIADHLATVIATAAHERVVVPA
jgi:hypothetical protein